MLRLFSFSICLLGLFAGTVAAETKQEKQAVIDQELKLETLHLVKDVRQLVESVAYPDKERVEIFLTHSPGRYFEIDNITLQIDQADKVILRYHNIEQVALERGGASRLYIGKLNQGLHELIAIFEGHDRGGNVIKKAVTWFIDKKTTGLVAEIKITDDDSTQRPGFHYKQYRVGR